MTTAEHDREKAAADEAMQDLVLTAVKAVVSVDRADWPAALEAAKRLEEHGMRLASLAARRVARMPVTS